MTVSSEEYGDSFGFTEREVFAVWDKYARADQKDEIKMWYDGFAKRKDTLEDGVKDVLRQIEEKQYEVELL